MWSSYFASDEFDKGDTRLFTSADGLCPPHPTANKTGGIGFLKYACGHAYTYAVDIICAYVHCVYTYVHSYNYTDM